MAMIEQETRVAAPESQAKPALTYLDNAATTYPKPPAVIDAVRACLGQSLTVARSTHVAGFRGDEVLRRCRAKLARFFGAAQPEEMVYTYSCTDGLNMALNGLVKPESHVIISPLEHHSVMRPLNHMCKSRGIEYTALPAGADGVVDPQEIKRLMRPDTSLIAINWISNVSGTVQPVAAIGEAARELGLTYLVDAAQAAGTHDVNVQAAGCDVMAQPAHKSLFSYPGLGVLYVRESLDLPPWRIGGTGYRSELLTQPQERPVLYEAGTPNVPAIVGLDAAMDWFEEVGLEAIGDHCSVLVSRLIEGLSAIEGVDVIGPPAGPPRGAGGGHLIDRGFAVSFTLGGVDPMVVSQILAERYGISSRAGLHCAPTAHRHFGTYERGGTVRFSVSYFTTAEQIELAIRAANEIAKEFSA
ncbi:aminotransferase class V-fold PLP-dependent enzyme [bacterium]|nr:aminotransferase class V-fold PLP-dependent enzyme [bacterium]